MGIGNPLLSYDERQALLANQDSGEAADRTTTASGLSIPSEGLIGKYPYSGADIKLVVHLPTRDGEEEESEELVEARQRLEQVTSALENVANDDEITALERELVELRQLKDAAVTSLEVLDPEHEDYQGYMDDIAEYEERIANLTAQYNSDRAVSGSREELVREQEQLTRSIEALLEDESPIPSVRTKTLAEIQTLSYSIHREKFPVRPLGTTYVRSYTRGIRTISGSIVFTTFNQHIFHEFFETAQYRSTGVGDWDRFNYTSYITDQLPPLDISISFANEYGNLSWMALLGVEFINEGQVMSIEDLFIEGTAQYVARDIDLIRGVANRPLRRNKGVGSTYSGETGTGLLIEDLRRRVAHRNNPFI